MDTSNVTNMSQMFLNCRSLKRLDLSSFNTNSVQNMSQMFGGCSDLRTLNITNFDTKKVTDMNGMFAGCETLEELDLSNFDTKNVQNMNNMFQASDALKSLKLGEKFVVPKNQEHNLKLVNRTWIDVGNGTTQNPKPTNKIGISSVELLKHHDKGNWVVKPEKEYLGTFKVIVANNLKRDIIVEVPAEIRPEYVGSVFEIAVPEITGYQADKKVLEVKATDEGLISNNKVIYKQIDTPKKVEKPVMTSTPVSNVTKKMPSSVQAAVKAEPIESVEPEKTETTGKVTKFMHYITVHPDLKYAQTYHMNGRANEGHQLRRNYSWFSDKSLQMGPQLYYHVLGDSWVKADDVYLYQDAKNTVKTKDVVMTNLFNSRAQLLTNRGLGALSTWPVAKEAIIGNHKYYQITTNEFVDADSVEIVDA